ncbi:hypothetical protein HMN09_00802800 [Mycena chlorophos]|uniref:Uncharacterized protein n=1 Tax=Mycena chlorophos TaxID=658473 RepID=A0A8H6SX32_MYCCL|nr:hypothetical protein HMN09_00802800 [Mycena chlorophos]
MDPNPQTSTAFYKPHYYCPDPFPATYPLGYVNYFNDGATGPRITNANPGSLECSYEYNGHLNQLSCIYNMLWPTHTQVSGNLTDHSDTAGLPAGAPFTCDSTAITAPCGVRCPLTNTASSWGDTQTGHLAMVTPSTTDDTTDCVYYHGGSYYFDATVSPSDLNDDGALDTPAKTTCVSPQRRAEIREQIEGMKIRRDIGQARASRQRDGAVALS